MSASLISNLGNGVRSIALLILLGFSKSFYGLVLPLVTAWGLGVFGRYDKRRMELGKAL